MSSEAQKGRVDRVTEKPGYKQSFGLTALSFVLAMSTLPSWGAHGAELTVFTSRYYEDPLFFKEYMQKYKIGPNFVFFDDEDEAMNVALNGLQADVGRICAASIPKWDDKGLLGNWNTSQLRDFELSGQVSGMKPYILPYADKFVPIEYGTTRLIFDSSQVPLEDVSSFDVFMNPEYSGKVSLPRHTDDLAAAAMLATGVTDWSTATKENVDAALMWLEMVHPSVHSYWEKEDVLTADMANGDVLVAWGWNSVLVENSRNLPSLEFAPNSSGVSSWICGYVRLSDSDAHSEAAHDFVNANISDAAAGLLWDWGLGHADNEVMTKQSTIPELKEFGLILPVDQLLFQSPMPAWMRDRFMEGLARIIEKS